MDKLCKNCKWWDDGICEALQSNYIVNTKSLYDKQYQTEDKTGFNIFADAADDTGLNAFMITGPEFGCVKFVEKG